MKIISINKGFNSSLFKFNSGAIKKSKPIFKYASNADLNPEAEASKYLKEKYPEKEFNYVEYLITVAFILGIIAFIYNSVFNK